VWAAQNACVAGTPGLGGAAWRSACPGTPASQDNAILGSEQQWNIVDSDEDAAEAGRETAAAAWYRQSRHEDYISTDAAGVVA